MDEINREFNKQILQRLGTDLMKTKEIVYDYQVANLINWVNDNVIHWDGEHQRANLSVEGKEINFRHVILKVFVRHLCKFVWQAIGYISPKIREEIWVGDVQLGVIKMYMLIAAMRADGFIHERIQISSEKG